MLATRPPIERPPITGRPPTSATTARYSSSSDLGARRWPPHPRSTSGHVAELETDDADAAGRDPGRQVGHARAIHRGPGSVCHHEYRVARVAVEKQIHGPILPSTAHPAVPVSGRGVPGELAAGARLDG